MRKATKRLPQPAPKVEVLLPVKSKAEISIIEPALGRQPMPRPPGLKEEYEEVTETTTTRTVKRRSTETAVPACSGEPIGSIVGRWVAVAALLFMALICVVLSVVAMTSQAPTMAFVSFFSAIALTVLTVSTARHEY